MKEYFLKDKTYYRTNEFSPDKLTLVFIHGLSGSSSAWPPYEKILENKYNILTYDIRGHGKSKKFPNYSDYEMRNFANDLHDLTSYLHIQKFIFCSHSFGTLIAAEYIKLWKDDVVANIFISPIIGLNENFSAKFLRFILKISGIFSLFPFNPKPGHHVDYTKHPNSTDWDLKRFYADVGNTTLRIYLYCLRQSLNMEQEYFLEKMKIPTLIVYGADDTMVPLKNLILMSKKIPDTELLLVPKTDHMIVLNNAAEVSGAIESFIEKNQATLSRIS